MKTLTKGQPKIEGEKNIRVNKTIKPVPRKESNVEVERNEIIVTDTLGTGFPELYTAAGHLHSSGGTPLNLPDNSFVFSQDKDMKIKDEEIQKEFNKGPKKSGILPSDIAKQYQINDYRKVLADKNSDKIQRDTAEMMIKNYNEKLGKLALVQESLKSYPDGIPFIAIPYLESMGIDPASLVNGSGNQGPEVPTSQEEDLQKKMGGSINYDLHKVYDIDPKEIDRLKKLGYDFEEA